MPEDRRDSGVTNQSPSKRQKTKGETMTEPTAIQTPEPGLVLYVIDWPDHYEVNRDGGRWAGGQQKRLAPLAFVRSYVFGPGGDNLAYTEAAQIVAEKYGAEAWIVAWGLFEKLLEVAARQKSHLRGYLLGRRQSPISPRMLATITCFTNDQITKGLEILTDPDIAWLQWRDMPVAEAVADVGDKSRQTPTLQEQEPKPNKKTNKNNETQNGDPGDDIDGKDLGLDSASASKATALPFDHGKTLLLLKGHLWPPGATQAQLNGDYTCLVRIATAIGHGELGDPADAANRCITQARHFATCQGNRMAMFSAWFTKQLPDGMTIRDLAG